MTSASLLRSERWQAVLGLGLLLATVALWRAGTLPSALAAAVADMANSGLSQRDIEVETQNYYEVLLDVGHQQRWTRGVLATWVARTLRGERTTEEGGNWVTLHKSDLVTSEPAAFLPYELKPSYQSVYMGVPVRTNQWGMRDGEVTLAKPAGTFRIALVGSSNDMGYGVRVEDGYPERLEARLNAELAGRGYERYEVLNFSVGGYQLLHRLYVTDTKVPRFHPDLIVVVATMHDLRWQVYEALVKRVRRGLDLHYDFLREIAARARVDSTQSTTRIRQRVRPRREELVSAILGELHAIGEREGVPVVLANFRLRVDPIHPEMIRQSELSRMAGLPTIEVFDAYEGQSGEEMYLTPTDAHPSVKAHALLADELYEDLLADEGIRRLLLEPLQRRTEARHGR
jgi:hypothetical protein